MTPLESVELYSYALKIGLISTGTCLLSLILCHIWPSIWMYIDDGEKRMKNPLVKFVMKLYGYRHRSEPYYDDYRNDDTGDDSEGEVAVFLTPIIIFLTPFLLVTLWVLLEVTLFIVTVIGVSVLARFTRRVHKRLNKHLKDHD